MDRSFLKHALVYGLATLTTQAAGFVLLPVYLRCLSPDDYGVLEVIGRLAEVVGLCLLFGGFRQALLTFHQQAADEAERRRVVCAAFALVVSVCVGGGLAAMLLGPRLAGWLTPEMESGLSPWLVRLAVAGILLEPLTLIPLGLLQARVESAAYVAVVFGQFVVRVALAILFVRYLDWGVAGALAATALTGAAFGVVLSVRELARGLAWPTAAHLRGLTEFALPLLPGGLCFMVLHAGDRLFLSHYASPADVGVYALGYKLAQLVAVFSLNPLYMVWSSHMYAVAQTPAAAETFGRMFTRVLAAFLLVGLALCLFADEVVALLGGAAYRGAAAVVPPVVLACAFQAGASLIDAGFYVRRKTGAKLGITAVAAAVMLALYAALIPPYGAAGAAAATLAGFAFLALATYAVGQHVFPVRYEWGRLAGLFGLAVGLWLLGRLAPPGAWGMAMKAGLWLVAAPAAWWAGLVRPDEKRQTRELLTAAVTRLTWRRGAEAEEMGALGR